MRYEYRCSKCSRLQEFDVPLSQEGEFEPLCCEAGCDGKPMARVISATSFALKGKGWAKDGYSG